METLFGCVGKRLHNFMTNLFMKLCTKGKQNCRSFVEDISRNILVSFFGTQCRMDHELVLVLPHTKRDKSVF